MVIHLDNRQRFPFSSGKPFVIILTLMAVVALSFPAQRVNAAMSRPMAVHFRDSAKVNTGHIVFTDIAEVITTDKALLDQLNRLQLAESPRPGYSKTLYDANLRSLLNGYEWVSQKMLQEIPKRIHIERLAQPLPQNQLQQAFRDYLKSRLDGAEFKISQFRSRGPQQLPLGKVTFTFPAIMQPAIKGRIHLEAVVSVNGSGYGRLMISAWIHRYQKVLQTTHLLPRGSIINAADLTYASLDVSKHAAHYLTAMEAAIGKRTRRQLRAGKALKPRLLETVPLIQKGDTVKLIAKNGSLKVVTLGVAQTDGVINGRVRVENLSSQKIVVGTVKDNATVEVLF